VNKKGLGEKDFDELKRNYVRFKKLSEESKIFAKGKSVDEAYDTCGSIIEKLKPEERMEAVRIREKAKKEKEGKKYFDRVLKDISDVKVEQPEDDFDMEEISVRHQILEKGVLKFSDLMPEKADGDSTMMKKIKAAMDNFNSLIMGERYGSVYEDDMNELEDEEFKDAFGKTISANDRQIALDRLDDVISACSSYLFWKAVSFSPKARARKKEVAAIKARAVLQRDSIKAVIKEENRNKQGAGVGTFAKDILMADGKLAVLGTAFGSTVLNAIYAATFVPLAAGFVTITAAKKMFGKDPQFYEKYGSRTKTNEELDKLNTNAMTALERAYREDTRNQELQNCMEILQKISDTEMALQDAKTEHLQSMVNADYKYNSQKMKERETAAFRKYYNLKIELEKRGRELTTSLKKIKKTANPRMKQHIEEAQKNIDKSVLSINNYLQVAGSHADELATLNKQLTYVTDRLIAFELTESNYSESEINRALGRLDPEEIESTGETKAGIGETGESGESIESQDAKREFIDIPDEEEFKELRLLANVLQDRINEITSGEGGYKKSFFDSYSNIKYIPRPHMPGTWYKYLSDGLNVIHSDDRRSEVEKEKKRGKKRVQEVPRNIELITNTKYERTYQQEYRDAKKEETVQKSKGRRVVERLFGLEMNRYGQ
jgi:hypothetical protein